MFKSYLYFVSSIGLGHASRSIPIINKLIEEKNTVHIVSYGNALEYLKKSCKGIQSFIEYKDYPQITTLKILQIPKIYSLIKEEHELTEHLVKTLSIDCVISDGRIGCHSKQVRSHIITHQFKVMNCGIEFISSEIANAFYNKFDRIIIPDIKGEDALAGKLSQTKNEKSYYCGILSNKSIIPIKTYIKYLFIISGPDNQRIELQNHILKAVHKLDGLKVVVLGSPIKTEYNEIETNNDKNTIIKSYVSNEEMNILMNCSEYIISSPGYTTIMDIVELEKKKVLFIRPDNNIEQIYLAKHAEKKNWIYNIEHPGILNMEYHLEYGNRYKGVSIPQKTKENINELYTDILYFVR